MIAQEELENQAVSLLSREKVQPDRARIREALELLVRFNPPAVEDESKYITEATKRVESRLWLTMDNVSVVQLKFEPWLEHQRSSVQLYYWKRYRQYLQDSGFPPHVLGTLDKDTDRIVGLLENPKKVGAWRRRGLVVGHVQSGKTANYTGVICKAADYGYKFIVLLAGMHNNLRRQTQERIEEGFIGLETDQVLAPGKITMAWLGVGKLDKTRQPLHGTTRTHDFKTANATTLGISFSNVNEPIILVVKKQKRVLENLVQWIQTKNPVYEGVVRNVPLLVIDDESDNASINTRAEDDPTQINKQIRALLAMFEQNCYIGYTATPFANIFIDPDTTHEMVSEDLFPRDFVACLDAPTNYIGASRIFSDTTDFPDMIQEVEDHEQLLPPKHKSDLQVASLPSSLEEAVRSFVLARAIRILRGRSTDHNSMLVNVSRFNSVQRQVSGLINDYLHDLRNAVSLHSMLPPQQALQDADLADLHRTWKDTFADSSSDWSEIQVVLNQAIGPVTVRIINNVSSDVLDYKNYKSEGLHVIAVGGLSLSRGFTLEGLTVSYFIRNSIMYDTLLQMGRWFGYRDGYADLCRLYMTPDATSWYFHISNAIDELRAEFKAMEKAGRRPEDFGLKVRAHPDSLIVTARNKMRTGRTILYSVDLQDRLIETTALSQESLTSNLLQLETFVQALDGHHTGENISQGTLWTQVPSSVIKQFLTGFKNHDDASPNTQVVPLVKYITAAENGHLAYWDVCLYDPKDGHSTKPLQTLGMRTVHLAYRTSEFRSDFIKVSGKGSRVASRGAEKVGLTSAEVAAAESEYVGKNVPDRAYRGKRKRPLLMLHVLDLGKERDERAAAWGISFPPAGEGGSRVSSELVEYVVNTVWWRENFHEDLDEEDVSITDEQ